MGVGRVKSSAPPPSDPKIHDPGGECPCACMFWPSRRRTGPASGKFMTRLRPDMLIQLFAREFHLRWLVRCVHASILCKRGLRRKCGRPPRCSIGHPRRCEIRMWKGGGSRGGEWSGRSRPAGCSSSAPWSETHMISELVAIAPPRIEAI